MHISCVLSMFLGMCALLCVPNMSKCIVCINQDCVYCVWRNNSKIFFGYAVVYPRVHVIFVSSASELQVVPLYMIYAGICVCPILVHTFHVCAECAYLGYRSKCLSPVYALFINLVSVYFACVVPALDVCVATE